MKVITFESIYKPLDNIKLTDCKSLSICVLASCDPWSGIFQRAQKGCILILYRFGSMFLCNILIKFKTFQMSAHASVSWLYPEVDFYAQSPYVVLKI